MALAEPPLRRTRGRSRAPGSLAAAFAVAVAAIAAIAAAALFDRSEADVRAWDRPRDVTVVAGTADGLWVGEPATASLLRLDDETGRTEARLAVGAQARAIDDRLWVLAGSQLAVVDPASNTVVARVALTTPDGEPYKGFDAFPSGRSVWVADAFGALLLSRSTLTPRRRVTVADEGPQVAAWAPAGPAVWLARGDGSVERFDGSSGRRTLRVPPVVTGVAPRILADHRGVTVMGADAIVQLEPSGELDWRVRVRQPPRAATLAGAVVAVQSQHPTEPHDRLTLLDRGDGRRLAEIDLPIIGSGAVAATTSRVWLSAPGGRLVSVGLPR